PTYVRAAATIAAPVPLAGAEDTSSSAGADSVDASAGAASRVPVREGETSRLCAVVVVATGSGGGGGGVAEEPLAALTNDHLASSSTDTVGPEVRLSLESTERSFESLARVAVPAVGLAMLPAAVIVKMMPVLAAAAAARRPIGPVTYSPRVVSGVTGRRSARYLPPVVRCDKDLPLLVSPAK